MAGLLFLHALDIHSTMFYSCFVPGRPESYSVCNLSFTSLLFIHPYLPTICLILDHTLTLCTHVLSCKAKVRILCQLQLLPVYSYGNLYIAFKEKNSFYLVFAVT